MSNILLETKIAIEVQIYSHNFKIKGKEKNIGYIFKLIKFYKL